MVAGNLCQHMRDVENLARGRREKSASRFIFIRITVTYQIKETVVSYIPSYNFMDGFKSQAPKPNAQLV